MVLLIAAGIHFVAPARPARTIVESSSPTPSTAESAPPQSPELARSGTVQPPPAAPRRQRLASSRANRTSGDIGEPAASPTRVETPQFDTPVVASLEVPESSLPFESIGMPVSGEFVEPLVTPTDRESGDDRDAASRIGRQRDPVTAAFVTAGSAVAGGFRSAGRALKRAF